MGAIAKYCVSSQSHTGVVARCEFLQVLVVAFDLTANDGNSLRTLLTSSNALMMKVGPI
jgi:hypothetical protein